MLGVWERHRPLKTTRALVLFVCYSLGGSVAPPTFMFWILSLVAGREDYPDCATGIPERVGANLCKPQTG